MVVLIAYASAHGSTRDIAERIGLRLRESGLTAMVTPVDGPIEIEGYEAIVVGSAIHNGRWLSEADDFIVNHSAAFPPRPVWLFSVGTVGASSSALGFPATWLARKTGRIPKTLPGLLAGTHARGHRAFAGVIRREDWGRGGSAFLYLMGGRYGDHRDWTDIDRWATGIAHALLGSARGTQ